MAAPIPYSNPVSRSARASSLARSRKDGMGCLAGSSKAGTDDQVRRPRWLVIIAVGSGLQHTTSPPHRWRGARHAGRNQGLFRELRVGRWPRDGVIKGKRTGRDSTGDQKWTVAWLAVRRMAGKQEGHLRSRLCQEANGRGRWGATAWRRGAGQATTPAWAGRLPWPLSRCTVLCSVVTARCASAVGRQLLVIVQSQSIERALSLQCGE